MSNSPNPIIELSHFKIETSSRYIKVLRYYMIFVDLSNALTFQNPNINRKKNFKNTPCWYDQCYLDKKIIYHEESKEV